MRTTTATAHDPRTQFLNWALVYNGAWDFPANVRGYTYGVALDYNHSKNLSFSYGVFTVPAVANGAALDWHLLKAQGQVAEMENRYEINGRPGTLRLLTFLNHAHMGNYNEALQLMPVDPDITKTRSYRYKYGFGVSFDQALTDDIGFFSRLGWNDGHTESWAFTEIDRTASAGFVMGGRRWCRPDDRIGLAGILNGISGPHRDYLAAGGVGFIIGDGRLKYGLEQILETYYAWQGRERNRGNARLPGDCQPRVQHPARSRGGRLDSRALGPLITRDNSPSGQSARPVQELIPRWENTAWFWLQRTYASSPHRHIPTIAAENQLEFLKKPARISEEAGPNCR